MYYDQSQIDIISYRDLNWGIYTYKVGFLDFAKFELLQESHASIFSSNSFILVLLLCIDNMYPLLQPDDITQY